jgi:transmembrane sensor
MTDEMYSLLGKYFSGQATAEEESMVRQWAEASEQNRADFSQLEILWSMSGEHEQIHFDTGKAWQKVNARLNPAKQGLVRRMKLPARAMAVAASVVVLLGMWWLFRDMYGNRTVVADIAIKEVQLEDGSKVYLRRGATLEFPRRFKQNRRDVSLKGEAFFEVSPDAAKPFVISADDARVEVVGTSFSVHTGTNEVELIVKTGRVKLGPADEEDRSILVTAGERAMLAGDDLTKGLNTDENFNAWQSKQLVFNNTSLAEVVAVLIDYYNVRINIKKEDAVRLSGATLTARFNDQPLDAVMNEISLITSYRIQRISDTAYEISLK